MKDKDAKKKDYATKTEINELNNKFDKLLDVLAKKPEDKKEEHPEVKIEQQPTPDSFQNPKWIEAVRKILGSKVGIHIVYSDKGPVKIQISIPEELSNAPEDIWEFYKCDTRTIVLNSGEGSDKIKIGCTKIAHNLGLDKKDLR